MTADTNQPQYGPYTYWGGETPDQRQQGPADHSGPAEDRRGPWGHRWHGNSHGAWSYRDRQQQQQQQQRHEGTGEEPRYGGGAPEQPWREPRAPHERWGQQRESWCRGSHQQHHQQQQQSQQQGWGQDGQPQERWGQRWGGCGGRGRHSDQQDQQHSHGPSWTGVALTGAGVFGLYKLFSSRKH